MPNLRKTKLCSRFSQGRCPAGADCKFAHGEQELRATVDFYKTSLCKDWAASGCCPRGDFCRYAHGAQELRAPGGGTPAPGIVAAVAAKLAALATTGSGMQASTVSGSTGPLDQHAAWLASLRPTLLPSAHKICPVRSDPGSDESEEHASSSPYIHSTGLPTAASRMSSMLPGGRGTEASLMLQDLLPTYAPPTMSDTCPDQAYWLNGPAFFYTNRDLQSTVRCLLEL